MPHDPRMQKRAAHGAITFGAVVVAYILFFLTLIYVKFFQRPGPITWRDVLRTGRTQYTKNVLILIPNKGFDVTEVALTWYLLNAMDHSITFATESGEPGTADELVLRGYTCGMGASRTARKAYAAMRQSPEYANTYTWAKAASMPLAFDCVILPGGHHKDIKPFLTSPVVTAIAERFLKDGKIVGALCHGTLVLTNKGSDGQPLIKDKQVTTLPRWMERVAYHLTRFQYGRYHLETTWPHYTEDLVRQAQSAEGGCDTGPRNLCHLLSAGEVDDVSHAHVVIDDNLVTARYPGDVYAFVGVIAGLLEPSTSRKADPNALKEAKKKSVVWQKTEDLAAAEAQIEQENEQEGPGEKASLKKGTNKGKKKSQKAQ